MGLFAKKQKRRSSAEEGAVVGIPNTSNPANKEKKEEDQQQHAPAAAADNKDKDAPAAADQPGQQGRKKSQSNKDTKDKKKKPFLGLSKARLIGRALSPRKQRRGVSASETPPKPEREASTTPPSKGKNGKTPAVDPATPDSPPLRPSLLSSLNVNCSTSHTEDDHDDDEEEGGAGVEILTSESQDAYVQQVREALYQRKELFYSQQPLRRAATACSQEVTPEGMIVDADGASLLEGDDFRIKRFSSAPGMGGIGGDINGSPTSAAVAAEALFRKGGRTNGAADGGVDDSFESNELSYYNSDEGGGEGGANEASYETSFLETSGQKEEDDNEVDDSFETEGSGSPIKSNAAVEMRGGEAKLESPARSRRNNQQEEEPIAEEEASEQPLSPHRPEPEPVTVATATAATLSIVPSGAQTSVPETTSPSSIVGGRSSPRQLDEEVAEDGKVEQQQKTNSEDVPADVPAEEESKMEDIDLVAQDCKEESKSKSSDGGGNMADPTIPKVESSGIVAVPTQQQQRSQTPEPPEPSFSPHKLLRIMQCNDDTTLKEVARQPMRVVDLFYDKVCQPSMFATNQDDLKRRPFYDEEFTMEFLHSMMTEGVTVLYLQPPGAPNNPSQVDWNGRTVTMVLEPGATGDDYDIQPKLEWTTIAGGTTYDVTTSRLGLLSILSIHSSAENNKSSSQSNSPRREEGKSNGEYYAEFPVDESSVCFFTITSTRGDVYVFEANSPSDRDRIVAGLRNVLARLAFHLVAGDVKGSSELYCDDALPSDALDPASGISPADLPRLARPHQAMNRIAHALLD